MNLTMEQRYGELAESTTDFLGGEITQNVRGENPSQPLKGTTRSQGDSVSVTGSSRVTTSRSQGSDSFHMGKMNSVESTKPATRSVRNLMVVSI